MKRKPWVSSLLYVSLIVSVLVFFLAPRHAYLAKFVYVAILAGYGWVQHARGNRRAAIVSAIGMVFLLLTLTGWKTVASVEILLMFIGWGIAMYLAKRAKDGTR